MGGWSATATAPPAADHADTGRIVGSARGAWRASRLAQRGPSLRTGSPPDCNGQPDEHKLASVPTIGPQVCSLTGSPSDGIGTECGE